MELFVVLYSVFIFYLFVLLGKDLIPAFATFLLCLTLGVEYGILVGVGVNIVLLLYPSARPSLHVEKNKVSLLKKYVLVSQYECIIGFVMIVREFFKYTSPPSESEATFLTTEFVCFHLFFQAKEQLHIS